MVAKREEAIRVFQKHGLVVHRLTGGRVLIENNSPFSGRSVKRFGTLCQAVDYFKPILLDDDLFRLYV